MSKAHLEIVADELYKIKPEYSGLLRKLYDLGLINPQEPQTWSNPNTIPVNVFNEVTANQVFEAIIEIRDGL